MAKEFKDFDKAFSKARIANCRKKWLYDNVKDISEVQCIKKWRHVTDSLMYQTYTASEIRIAVYFSQHKHVPAVDWQLFRVSMKGLTTQEKLFALEQRLKALDEYMIGIDGVRLEECRIYNYLGALIRGGQLNKDYEIVR